MIFSLCCVINGIVLAQQPQHSPDRRAPHHRDLRDLVTSEMATERAKGMPPNSGVGVPDFSKADLIWIRNALLQMASSGHPEARRAQVLAETIVENHFSRREAPLVMMALSLASKYPEACDIMQRIVPRSVCTK